MQHSTVNLMDNSRDAKPAAQQRHASAVPTLHVASSRSAQPLPPAGAVIKIELAHPDRACGKLELIT